MEIYTIDEASKVLRCGRTKVRQFIVDGHLEAINIGKGTKRARWIIPAESLEAFVLQRKGRQTKKGDRPPWKRSPGVDREQQKANRRRDELNARAKR